MRIPAIFRDVSAAFAHEGITSGIRRTFVVYLASLATDRVARCSFSDTARHPLESEHNFTGMTVELVIA